MYKYFVLLFIILFSFSLHANESQLTFQQQLDRLQREVSDISKLIFTEEENFINKKEEDVSNLTAFDLRIYNIEKDIKLLNNIFEELSFELDDLRKIFDDLDENLKNKLTSIKNIKSSDILVENISEENNLIIDEENTLGKIIISKKDLSNLSSNELSNEIFTTETKEEDSLDLSPEKEFQNILDLLRGQKFIDARDSLIKFIEKNPNSSLSSEAHYWLGEIYILKKEYIEAAVVFAEGYEKFPNENKTPDMLYKLSETLIKIDKIDDSCRTLKKFYEEFSEHKLLIKVKNKSLELSCDFIIE